MTEMATPLLQSTRDGSRDRQLSLRKQSGRMLMVARVLRFVLSFTVGANDGICFGELRCFDNADGAWGVVKAVIGDRTQPHEAAQSPRHCTKAMAAHDAERDAIVLAVANDRGCDIRRAAFGRQGLPEQLLLLDACNNITASMCVQQRMRAISLACKVLPQEAHSTQGSRQRGSG
jgi:hypothetical protein